MRNTCFNSKTITFYKTIYPSEVSINYIVVLPIKSCSIQNATTITKSIRMLKIQMLKWDACLQSIDKIGMIVSVSGYC